MDSLLKRLIKEIELAWRKELRWNALISSLALSLIVGALGLNMLGETDALIISLFALGIFFVLFNENEQLTPQRIISELNRRRECEHSAELLLSAPEELAFLARLQQRKVAAWLEKQDAKSLIPNNWQKRLLWLVGSVILSTLIVAFPKTALEEKHLSENAAQTVGTQRLIKGIEGIEVEIEPPAYTLKPKRVQSSLNILAEENAAVRWTLKTSRTCEEVKLAMVSGDTLHFKQTSERTYCTEMKASQSQLYTLMVEEFISELATVEVSKDLPPVVSVISPVSRTDFSSPDSARLFIKVAVSDDYKIRTVNLVLTTAKGRGEAVKFKSDTIRLRPTATLENGIEQYQTSIDLKNYELTYGDEGYFFVEAFDNHEPKANVARSETYFTKILDTLQAVTSESIAMPVLRLPTYFRSQRQIIIDTEKLIAEKKSLESSIFKKQSENLGIDQKLLRLRYGKFLGEELAISIGETENEQRAKVIRDTSRHPIVKLQKQAAARMPKADDGHDHNEPTQAAQSTQSLIEPYMHQHDIKEAATFFSEPIKQKLKATLAQMWEAEKFLRLVQPERALPYEYKALQLLKELQQDARVYVEKSGFEPTPIEEARLRLTGENAKIKSARYAQMHNSKDSLEAIKHALTILNSRKKTFSNDELSTLEEAGKHLAKLALEKNLSQLSAIQSLRELIADAKQGRAYSDENLLLVQYAFNNILPVPYQLPTSKPQAHSPLTQRYFQLLDQK